MLQVFVGQRAAKLQAIKNADLKKSLPLRPNTVISKWPGFDSLTIGSSSKFEGIQLAAFLSAKTYIKSKNNLNLSKNILLVVLPD